MKPQKELIVSQSNPLINASRATIKKGMHIKNQNIHFNILLFCLCVPISASRTSLEAKSATRMHKTR